jgi:hypothetical protein
MAFIASAISAAKKIGIEVTAVDTVNAVGWFWADE